MALILLPALAAQFLKAAEAERYVAKDSNGDVQLEIHTRNNVSVLSFFKDGEVRRYTLNDLVERLFKSSAEVAAPPKTVTSEPQPRHDETLARQLYNSRCAECHGKDGRGDEARSSMPRIPDFSSPTWVRSHSSTRLTNSILYGRGENMPPFVDTLNIDQVRHLSSFVRTFAPPDDNLSESKPSDFARRRQKLLDQWNDLQRQLKALRKRRRRRGPMPQAR